MRQVIIGILAIALIAGAVFVAKNTIANKKGFETVEASNVTAVFTQSVANVNSSIKIVTSGQLLAKNRLNLFSEVQGVFEPGSREFKPGVHYKKGDLLMKINSDEYYSTLQAQKSTLYNQIIAIMPDLRLDYPESFPAWDTYVREFDLQAPLKVLPTPVDQREKLFISGRNIFTTYYNVQNLERRYEKYNIYAPFNGVLTEALVQPGTLVRVGQGLGEFIDLSVYELEAAVNIEYLDLLRIGKAVSLSNIQHTKSYQGKVVRLNGKVDQTTQTITVFIQVQGKDLKEGMYMEAELEAKEEAETYEISRKLLREGNQVFAVRDSTIYTVEVNPVYFKEKTVIVRGLEAGTEIISRPIPGSYPGMKVYIVNDNKSDSNN